MTDLTNNSIVEEYVKSHTYNRLWLCPHLVSSGKIGFDPLLHGYECTPSTVPELLRNKKVVSHYNDSGVHCIIWFNEEDIPLKLEDIHFNKAEGRKSNGKEI